MNVIDAAEGSIVGLLCKLQGAIIIPSHNTVLLCIAKCKLSGQ